MSAKEYQLKGSGRLGWSEGKELKFIEPTDVITKKELDALPKEKQHLFQEYKPSDQTAAPTTQQPKRSMDMHSDEAIETINNRDAESLEGFLSDHEDRITVLDAWDAKFKEEPDSSEEGDAEGDDSNEGVNAGSGSTGKGKSADKKK